jgi:hypothetical protein
LKSLFSSMKFIKKYISKLFQFRKVCHVTLETKSHYFYGFYQRK